MDLEGREMLGVGVGVGGAAEGLEGQATDPAGAGSVAWTSSPSATPPTSTSSPNISLSSRSLNARVRTSPGPGEPGEQVIFRERVENGQRMGYFTPQKKCLQASRQQEDSLKMQNMQSFAIHGHKVVVQRGGIGRERAKR